MSNFTINLNNLSTETENLKNTTNELSKIIDQLNQIVNNINLQSSSNTIIKKHLKSIIYKIDTYKNSSKDLNNCLLNIINYYQNTEKMIINIDINKNNDFSYNNTEQEIPDKETYDKMMADLSDYDKKCGITLVYIDGKWYYDYSTPINNRLKESLEEFQKHHVSSYEEYIEKYGTTFYTPNPTSWYSGVLGSFWWFRDQVNHNAPWDIKREEPWQTQFGNMRYPDADETMIVNGEKMTREDMGNYTYGYLGSAMGIDDTTLYWGGGVAKNGMSSVFGDEVYEPPYYGDDANDHIMIKKGIDAYCEDYPDDLPTCSLIS